MADVLFVCVHNAGRSQMAAAFFNDLAAKRGLDLTADSAGTMPSSAVNPIAAHVMEEVMVPLAQTSPKRLSKEMAATSTRVITMGCGVDTDACPAGTLFTDDWGLDDPAGQPIDKVREIRDQVRLKVEELLDSMTQGM